MRGHHSRNWVYRRWSCFNDIPLI